MSFAPWIKIECTTPDKPEVIAMAARLRMQDPDTVTGKLVRLWAWADANSVDGHRIAITRAFIDRLTHCRGFAAAMEAVGWLVEEGDGLLTFPGFDRHNGDSAKKRATEARKKQNQRAGDKGGKKIPPKAGTNVPHAPGQKRGPEEEIEKGERESGRDALLENLLSLRPEWSAVPVLSDPEREAFERQRPVFAAIQPATWDAMRRFMATRFPEGDARFQPRQRLLAIRSIGDLAAQAEAWANGSGKAPAPAAKPWPEDFERWARENYPSTPARALWMAPAMRKLWEDQQGQEDAA